MLSYSWRKHCFSSRQLAVLVACTTGLFESNLFVQTNYLLFGGPKLLICLFLRSRKYKVLLRNGDKPRLAPQYFQRFMHAAEQVSFHFHSRKVKYKDSRGLGILCLFLPSIALWDLMKSSAFLRFHGLPLPSWPLQSSRTGTVHREYLCPLAAVSDRWHWDHNGCLQLEHGATRRKQSGF